MRLTVGIVGVALMLIGLGAGPVLAAEPDEVAAALREARVYVAPGAEAVNEAALPAGFGGEPAQIRLAVLAATPAQGTRAFADTVLAETGGTVLVFTPDEVEVSSAVATDRQADAAFDEADARADIADTTAYAAAYDEALREQLTSGTDLPFDVGDFDLQRWLPWIIGGFLVLSVLGRLLRPRGRRYGRGRHVGRRRGGGMLGAAVGGRALGGARRSGTTRGRSSSRSTPRSRSSGSRRGGASRRR